MDGKVKIFTAFSGYDSQCLAMERLKRTHGVDYELVGWSEIDHYAIQAHNALFPQWSDRNYGDISKIDWTQVPDFDLFTYSFPCTDISSAGRQRGLTDGSGTRSSLLWECRKAIIAKRPKYLLMENVKALAGEKFRPQLLKWLNELENYGYKNYVSVLNAKDYGVPQNRKRVFVWSATTGEGFQFPKPTALKRKLNDVLEQRVAESYYLRDEIVEQFLAKTKRCEQTDGQTMLGYTRDKDGVNINYHPIAVANTLCTSSGSGGNTDQFVREDNVICFFGGVRDHAAVKTDGIATTLCTFNDRPMIMLQDDEQTKR